MQAEHIPVHLGAMPAAVAAVLHEDHSQGRSWILNDPFAGGTHLPDITVITPMLDDGELLGFAANRAHHADVGGRVPGIDAGGQPDAGGGGRGDLAPPLTEEAIEEIVARMRQPEERRADLRAQLAANRIGREAPGGAGGARGMRSACGRRRTRCWTTPSGARERACAACPTASYDGEGRAGGSRGRPRLQLRATVRRRAADP